MDLIKMIKPILGMMGPGTINNILSELSKELIQKRKDYPLKEGEKDVINIQYVSESGTLTNAQAVIDKDLKILRVENEKAIEDLIHEYLEQL